MVLRGTLDRVNRIGTWWPPHAHLLKAGNWPGVFRRKRNSRTGQDLNGVVAEITCTTVEHDPVHLTDNKIGGFQDERVFRAIALDIHHIVIAPLRARLRFGRAVVTGRTCRINSSLKARVAARAVGWSDLDGYLRGSGEETKPLVIVQHPTVIATRETALLVVVVDACAIAVKVVADNG